MFIYVYNDYDIDRAGAGPMSITPSGAPGVYPSSNLNSMMQRGGVDNFSETVSISLTL